MCEDICQLRQRVEDLEVLVAKQHLRLTEVEEELSGYALNRTLVEAKSTMVDRKRARNRGGINAFPEKG